MRIIRSRKFIFLIVTLFIVILGIILLYRKNIFLSKENSYQGLTVSDFSFITHDTSLKEVFDRMGKPQRDYCSGIYCPEYDLFDGRRIIISTGEPNHIWRVKVVDENGKVLEELLWQ
jgi:hypothetical protein